MKNIANEIKTIRYAFGDGRSTQKSIMRKVKALTDQFETMDDLIDSLNGYADTHYTWAITYFQLARIIVVSKQAIIQLVTRRFTCKVVRLK